MTIFHKILILIALGAISTSLDAQTDTLTTANGYRIINHTRHQGVHPKAGDYVTLHANTWLGDSLMGSTAASGPRDLAIPQPEAMPKRAPVVYDALAMMVKGDSVTVLQMVDSILRPFIPESLKNESIVRYEFVLLDVVSGEEHERRELAKQTEMAARLDAVATQTQQLAKDFKNGKVKKSQLQKTASGLQYVVHEPGTGALLQKGESVKVHYYGCLPDGKTFDESYSRGEALGFTIGEMIPGFDEGMQLLRHGAKATLFIPSVLGYGEAGAGDVIPPNTDLIFYVEIQ